MYGSDDVTKCSNHQSPHPSIINPNTRSTSLYSLLCIGLDPHLPNSPSRLRQRIPLCSTAYDFCTRLIDATLTHCVCYKPNAAFFKSLGHSGSATLTKVVKYIHQKDPECPVLLDVKRGDIGSTAEAYAEACCGGLEGEGLTLISLMGLDSAEPFVTG